MSASVLAYIAAGYVVLMLLVLWRIVHLAPGAYRNVPNEDGSYPE